MEQKILKLMAVERPERDLKWLKESLQAAIELELSTLPPYLCALWSIQKPDLTPGQAYDIINSVILQEMTHMGLVCNILTAIGGTPQIAQGYANCISYPGPLPGGVRPGLTVVLSGLTKPLVHDVFMQIEFPEGGPIRFVELAAAETFPTIGAFYDAIQDAFHQLSPTLTTARQLTSKGVGVTIIQTLTDVTDALSLIKIQGEGTSQSPDDGAGTDLAHYYRFAGLYVGKTLVAQPSGGFSFAGTPIPFPDAFTMPPIPKGGYRNASPAAKTALAAFNSLFSDLLDHLDTGWSTGNQGALSVAVSDMRKLAAVAQPLFSIPLPSPEDGFYGPDFRYIPKSKRTGATPGWPTASFTIPANPVFADIVKLLQSLTGNDPNLQTDSPHGAFWNQDYDAFMAQSTDAWGVPGNLVVKGKANRSNLFLALAGAGPFAQLRMPDPSDANGRFATPEELQMVSTWITNGCPQ